MTAITEAEFIAKPEDFLRRAKDEGAVVVRCADGSEVTLRLSHVPSQLGVSPLDVGFVRGLRLTKDEIVDVVREGQERNTD